MPVVVARPRVEVARKRRAHAKSRKGCSNCKLRSVKCDEAHPSCKKCKLYGVACDYSGQGSSLELDAHGSFQVQLEANAEPCNPEEDTEVHAPSRKNAINSWIFPLDSISINSSLATIVDISLRSNMSNPCWMNKSWHFTNNQLQVLSRFRERTSVTIGYPQMAPLYRDLVCQLACKYAFLMHMLLSVTLMHDAHLINPSAGATTTNSSQMALEHWTTASRLFNDVLSQPILPSYRDAIWATGVFLGAASFWSIGSTDPYDVWPLKPAEPDDLSWLRIGEGKKHLWRLAQPSRSDSIFCGLVKNHNCLTVPEWTATETAPGSGARIAAHVMNAFGMSALSEGHASVYYQSILALSKCPNVKLTHENALKFLYIMAVITPEFLELLEAKDMKAVFIMGWWYILLTTGDLWWISRRARIEGKAIRIWLRGQQGGTELADLLDEIERHSGEEETPARWFFEKCSGKEPGCQG